MTLDRLSAGRLVVPVGLGDLSDRGFGNVGEPTNTRIRAEMLDESLEILQGLWSGKPFAYAGRHFRFGPMTFAPAPLQKPHIPIWVVGAWPNERSMQRVLRFDGVLTQTDRAEDVRAIAEFVARNRPKSTSGRPFDVIAQGKTTPSDSAVATVKPFAEAGATWWIEGDWEGATIESLRRRILAGPPRV